MIVLSKLAQYIKVRPSNPSKPKESMYECGMKPETERWQGGTDHPAFLEILHADMMCPMSETVEEANDLLGAVQPWADEHFEERVGGIPCNPPPSHVHWLKDTDKYLMDEAFSHSYPERMWQDTEQMGVRFNIANLNTAVELLKKEPTTRQCYIPIWFPEDGTAALAGERVPCTFGWHFMLRENELHCAYHMRSCDVMRHLHNDLYFSFNDIPSPGTLSSRLIYPFIGSGSPLNR